MYARWIRSVGMLVVAAVALVVAPAGRAAAHEAGQAQAAHRGHKDADRLAQRRPRRRIPRPPAATPAAAPAATGTATDGAPSAAAQAAAASAAAPAEGSGSGGSLRRSNVMEFDARLIRGERAGTGAVILFERGFRELPPLTPQRTRFLDATIRAALAARGRRSSR